MRFAIILLIHLFFAPFCSAKPPSLTPHDTKVKIQEILKAHVSYQELNPAIIRRALLNYLDEVDPLKTYLLDYEVEIFTKPSEELITAILQSIPKEDFSSFYDFHATFLDAVERRNQMEEKINSTAPPTGVKSSEFKSLEWTASLDALQNRLLRMKGLQMDTAAKLSAQDQAQFAQKLTKRRLCREEELKGKTAEERKQIVLTHALKSISSALDSQTAYFTPTEATQFMMQVQQKLYGIGAQLRDDLNGLTVIRLIEGGPASISGKLRVSDKIIAVNHEPILGLDITDAVELIRGKQGTTVTLTILRTIDTAASKEDTLDVELMRDEVVLKETRLETSFYPFGDGVIGIFHLFSFYDDGRNSSASDLYQAIDEMKKKHNLKGVILDLRNNAGGLLTQAVAVTALFISKGVVVSVKHNTGSIEKLRNKDGQKVWDGPLFVLTNRASASASEIVAQTLQEYGRALVTGDAETFGKGTFQTFTLESSLYGKVNAKGEFKVTRRRYYTVSGKSPQLIGVKADIVIPGILSSLEIGEKYAKFPVGTDQIPPSFNDDLADISPFLRSNMRRLYETDKQEILETYTPYIETLRTNSTRRMLTNKNYQNFLLEAEKNGNPMELDVSEESATFYGQNDLQLTETLHIMSDLLFLEQTAESMEKRKAN